MKTMRERKTTKKHQIPLSQHGRSRTLYEWQIVGNQFFDVLPSNKFDKCSLRICFPRSINVIRSQFRSASAFLSIYPKTLQRLNEHTSYFHFIWCRFEKWNVLYFLFSLNIQPGISAFLPKTTGWSTIFDETSIMSFICASAQVPFRFIRIVCAGWILCI